MKKKKKQKKEAAKQKGPKRFGRHPWDEWFKRKRFTLKRGVDFSGMPHAMAVQVRDAATARDYSVSVKIREDVLLVERVK